jgi:hypothetical protein
MLSQQYRSPAAKLALVQLKKRGVKRLHSDDIPRREFFAGLVVADTNNARSAVDLMAIANEHYDCQKRPRLTEKTAQRWKRDCLASLEAFTAGPNYSHEGNKRLGDDEVKRVREFVLENPYDGERQHSLALEVEGINISSTWIRDLRKSEPVDHKIQAFKIQTKLHLTQAHMDKRVLFCQLRALELWPMWVFSDEYTFCINAKRGLYYYARRREDVPVMETTKYAASFHVFAAITRDGVLSLRFYDDSLNSKEHCRLLKLVFNELAEKRNGLPCIFQHDNSSYSTSEYTQDWLQDNEHVQSGLIRPLNPGEWPAYSPDLNIIENLMAHVKHETERSLAKLGPGVERCVTLYRNHLLDQWAAVRPEIIKNLYDSLPQRCLDVIAKKGRPLKN